MGTFDTFIKKEMSRVARKEIRAELASLQRVAKSHRSEIAELRQKIKTLEALQNSGVRHSAQSLKVPLNPRDSVASSSAGLFDATAFAEHRKHLGLTQAQMAKVLEASALSIYKWESGRVHPRAAQLKKIRALRKLGKRAVLAKLAQ